MHSCGGLVGKTTGSVKTELEALYSTPSFNITIYQETDPATYSYLEQGLWDAGNTYVAAARAVSDLPSTYRYNFTNMAQWNYLLDNAGVLLAGFQDALDLQASSVCSDFWCPYMGSSVLPML